ncbi:LLM class F420-dependent oxidoreductase [Solwaraspora sp. WMMB335]|uniref:LLM class F420-dependent oxidoreductase n=1 Tax=Solwaraspora sp. WMMB335 TaxID=3404118 RepID=UPI003B93B5F9
MEIGVVLPQGELHGGPRALREYARAVQDLGFGHLFAYDHVLGADPAGHPGWRGVYDVDHPFHEPLVLFGYLAGVCDLDLVTGVLVLPQRQTALVAKQAAEVDLLSGGRLRLGVGIGWNSVEYEALGRPMRSRGERLDQQIALLRALWQQRSVTFGHGGEQVVAAGINPLPQRPIPIWIGGACPAAYRRAGRIGDGWMPRLAPGPELAAARAMVMAAAEAAGRPAAAIGMHGRVRYTDGGAAGVAATARRWREAGATHLAVSTLGAGFSSLGEHLEALTAIARTGLLREDQHDEDQHEEGRC